MGHCGKLLLTDIYAHSPVGHDVDSTGRTDPAGGSDPDLVTQVLIAVGPDFEDHCEGAVQSLLVSPSAVARAATFHPYLVPGLCTAHSRHRNCFDLGNPRQTCRTHQMAHLCFDIHAKAPDHSSAPLDLLGRTRVLQRQFLEKARMRTGGLYEAVFEGLHIVAAGRTPYLEIICTISC